MVAIGDKAWSSRQFFLMPLGHLSDPLGGLAKATPFLRGSTASKFRRRRSPRDFVFVFIPRLPWPFPVLRQQPSKIWSAPGGRSWCGASLNLGIGFQRFDEYFAELFAYFAQPKAWTLYPEVTETLSALEKRGMILSVISNFDSRLIGILEGLGAAHSVRAYFCLKPRWLCETRSTDFSHSPGTAQFESQ